MTESVFLHENQKIRVVSLNTVVVGTGAAGFNAAGRLFQFGQTDVAIITNHINAGTSRNTGSDKQTYYKLTLCGEEEDSVLKMAKTIFAGGCVDGDHALCEAALSAQSFYNLVEKGVPFPRTKYGEYTGYKTDHDPCTRGTSVGPYTSKYMTEALQEECSNRSIPLFDNMQVIGLLQDNNIVHGLLCLDMKSNDSFSRYVAFQCENVIFATGGPAGIYLNSVYPQSQIGCSGVALAAGVVGKNLTEWQYGLASVNPRWNVSGTYMQVLPRFISTDENKSDKKEFLMDFFTDKSEMLSKVFLKGYQWPFDVQKIKTGSSIIDILVYVELCKGRRIFLDFTSNPLDEEVCFDLLDKEVFDYLNQAGACCGTPIERLAIMNTPAIDFYHDRGVNLHTDLLEITLSAQHNNGGLSVDEWWQTNIKGFFAVGEVAGTHGVYRPGGSALNSGQVGSLRAAQFVSHKTCTQNADSATFSRLLRKHVSENNDEIKAVMNESKEKNVTSLLNSLKKDMSLFAGPIRSEEGLKKTKQKAEMLFTTIKDSVVIHSEADICKFFVLKDTLVTQLFYLEAMIDYLKAGGKSRGSALYTDLKGEKPSDSLPDTFCFSLDSGSFSQRIQEVCILEGEMKSQWRSVRPIPNDDLFFENVWRKFRETSGIF